VYANYVCIRPIGPIVNCTACVLSRFNKRKSVSQYAEQGLYNATVSVRLSISLSVPAQAHSSKPAAAVGPAGAQQQRRENAGSATLSAYVGS